MERPASRRRHQPSETEETKDGDAEEEEKKKKKKKTSVSLLPTILYAAILVLFLRLLGFHLSPLLSDNNKHSSPSPLSPLSPLGFELHPQEHIYRPPATIRLNWTITSAYRRPDGVKKRVYLINGAFPGPTVETRPGDRLLINVTNELQHEGVSLHWHGLHMRGANAMDGVAGVTQCPIEPGSAFLYDFKISDEQTGTYWYHSHSGLQRGDGLYGGLVVHRPAMPAIRGMRTRRLQADSVKYNYHSEHLLLIGDWYHRPAEEVLAWYMRAASYGNEPVPDSLLINRVGHFNCSMAVPARPLDCTTSGLTPPELQLEFGVSHRLRIVNTGSLAGFTLHFEHATIELIQVDGGIDVEPAKRKAKSVGILYPGQRMDLVIRPWRKQKQSSLTVELDPECFNYPNPALTEMQTFPLVGPSHTRTRSLFSLNPWTSAANRHIDLSQISSTKAALSALPAQADKTFVVYTKISRMARNQNAPFGYFNHTSFRPQANPPYPLIALDRDQWDENQFSLSTGDKPIWIDFIVNNLDEGAHPFHLHGHTFFILSLFESTIGWGSYNPHEPHLNPSPHPPYDLSKALERDTVQIPRRGHAVLRVRADNPGVWLFHCHILWHLASGMAMLLEVMNKGSNGKVEMEACRYVY